jgi:glutathione S-transferase
MFFEVMSGAYATRVFCAERSPLARAIYRAAFPVIHPIMKRSMGIDAESAALARERTHEALDFVARETKGSDTLVGDHFGIADLTCAALLMPAVDVARLGGPASAGTAQESAWRARWAQHPGAAWVREIYRRHRRP